VIVGLIVLVQLLEDCGEVPAIEWQEFLAAKKTKIEKLNKYLKLSNSLGTIPKGFTV
jgi:hypothetical protein